MVKVIIYKKANRLDYDPNLVRTGKEMEESLTYFILLMSIAYVSLHLPLLICMLIRLFVLSDSIRLDIFCMLSNICIQVIYTLNIFFLNVSIQQFRTKFCNLVLCKLCK